MTTGAPASIQISSGDNGSSDPGCTDYEIASPWPGAVSFDWNYYTANGSPVYDPFGYFINGIYTQLTNDTGSVTQTGSISFSISASDIFGFRAETTDNIYGRSTTTLSNFNAPVPLPIPILLLGSGLVLVTAVRNKME